MGQVKVSVIIPVYNGEKYLRTCVESILNQSFTDFELICVNDGSTDSTGEILDQYTALDKRVSVYNQENKYAGAARNTGMSYAAGEYLIFLDGDDFFEKELLEKMYCQAAREKADICVCDVWNYDEKSEISKPGKAYLNHKLLPEDIPFSAEDAGNVIFNFTTMHLWNKMFRADFIKQNHIRFKEYRIQEDTGFVMHALSSAGRITIADERLIHYRTNTESSLTDSLTEEPLAGYNAFSEAKRELQSRGVYSEQIQRSFANKALGNCMHFFRKINKADSYDILFHKLVCEGGFIDLDIQDYGDASYYYDKNAYRKFLKMQECGNAGEYLFFLLNEERESRVNQSVRLNRCEEELKAVKKQLKKERQQRKKLESEKKRCEDTICQIRQSKTFRAGKAIMWLPRKISGRK